MVSAIRQVTKGKIPILTGEIRALVEREFNRLRDILSLDKDTGIYSFKNNLVTTAERKTRKQKTRKQKTKK